MNFVRVTSPDDPMFVPAMGLYQISFPVHEQREAVSQKEILHHEDYHFDLIYAEGVFAGVLLYWETTRFLYVEHFCIDPDLRGQRCGQRALELLGRKGKTVILEIDPPGDEISVRRKAFYERCGYHANPYSHIHPPYHKGKQGHELVIMSYPRPLAQGEYEEFKAYLKAVVMGV